MASSSPLTTRAKSWRKKKGHVLLFPRYARMLLMISSRSSFGSSRMPPVAFRYTGNVPQRSSSSLRMPFAKSMSGLRAFPTLLGSPAKVLRPGACRSVQWDLVFGYVMSGGRCLKTRAGHLYTCILLPVDPASMIMPWVTVAGSWLYSPLIQFPSARHPRRSAHSAARGCRVRSGAIRKRSGVVPSADALWRSRLPGCRCDAQRSTALQLRSSWSAGLSSGRLAGERSERLRFI